MITSVCAPPQTFHVCTVEKNCRSGLKRTRGREHIERSLSIISDDLIVFQPGLDQERFGYLDVEELSVGKSNFSFGSIHGISSLDLFIPVPGLFISSPKFVFKEVCFFSFSSPLFITLMGSLRNCSYIQEINGFGAFPYVGSC